MTVQQMKDVLGLKLLAGETGLLSPVGGCYLGDLLSWVMGRAQEEDAWITVMGNINAVAVAKLADVSCIILCENAHLDEDAKAQAEANGIPVLAGEQSAYQLAVELYRLLGE